MGFIYKKTNNSWGVKATANGQNFIFEPKPLTPKVWTVLSKNLFEKDEENKKPSAINIFQLFSKSSQQIWLEAQKNIKNSKAKKITAINLFMAALDHSSLNDLWKRLELNPIDVKIILQNYQKLSLGSVNDNLQKLPFITLEESIKLHCPNIHPLILLYGLMICLPYDHIIQAIFANLKLAPEKLEILACWILELDYKFTHDPLQQKYLDCYRRLKIVEQHNNCLFTYPAVELAIHNSTNALTATKILVKASLKAKLEKNKIINQAQIKKFLR